MPDQATNDAPQAVEWHRITYRLAEVLRELADDYNLPMASERLHLTYNGVRSDVEKLKNITGWRDVRDMGRWWRNGGRAEWAMAMGDAAGVKEGEVEALWAERNKEV